MELFLTLPLESFENFSLTDPNRLPDETLNYFSYTVSVILPLHT